MIASAAAAAMTLSGSEWAKEDSPDVYVQFKDGQVSGSGGCNRFSGSYSQEGVTIRIGPLMSTRMACPEPVMEKERAFFAVLEGAAKVEATHKTLLIRDGEDREIAVLIRRDWD
jgi:heat shock protein HslJ